MNSKETLFTSFEAYTGENLTIRPELTTGILQYEWQVSGSHSSTNLNLTGNSLNFRTSFTANQSVTISLRMRNNCGWSNWATATIFTRTNDHDPTFVYPNPSTHELTVQQSDNGTFEDFGTSELCIYDSFSREIIHIRNPKVKQVIDISGFKPGIYYIHLIQGDKISRKQLMVER